MTCYHPLSAWQPASGGSLHIGFSKRADDRIMHVPCGKCIGCRISRSRAWAVRLMHEAKLHEDNSFVTLTYGECCPGELVKRDLQLFFKRLRNETGVRFRYFGVGEYGGAIGRPHYHVLLFGLGFPDAKYWCGRGLSRQGRSGLLERVWTAGHSTVGTVTAQSATYVAKYCIKLKDGKAADGRAPEFAVMSRRPGIGAGWIDKYAREALPRDFVIVDGGKSAPVPRYYLERQPESVKDLVGLQRLRGLVDRGYTTRLRLRQMEEYVECSVESSQERRLAR